MVEVRRTWWEMAVLKAELFKEAATPLESEPLSLCWDRREPDSRGGSAVVLPRQGGRVTLEPGQTPSFWEQW